MRISLALVALALPLAGCVVYPDGTVAASPVYVAPAPVYVAPAPVYVAPRPVYVAPRYHARGWGHRPYYRRW